MGTAGCLGVAVLAENTLTAAWSINLKGTAGTHGGGRQALTGWDGRRGQIHGSECILEVKPTGLMG